MNEIDIPIDIHCIKLLEWLISRRIVPKNFQPQIHVIRNKIAEAINDMPENEDLKSLLSGSHINYIHCKSIVEILKQTEKDTKSVFGTYGSKRMKDWLEILKLYEKDNVYLAEAAQILIRYQTYEIPGLWKQIDRCEQQSDESLKKIKDLSKTEQILKHDHELLCQQLGIKGINLREELIERLKELPNIYNESINEIEQLNDAVKLYMEFSNNFVCPLINHLIKFGNTTVYEYNHKEAPIKIEENPIILNLSDEIVDDNVVVDDENCIEFGSTDGNSGRTTDSAEIIDFGDLNSSDNINWGEGETSPITPTGEIDFDITLEEYDIVIEEVGIHGGIAKGDQAYTILDLPSYRDKFIDELYELESFFKLRYFELNMIETSGNIMISLMDNDNSTAAYDTKTINKILIKIKNIIYKVCNEQTQHLFQLKHSPKYANIIETKLKHKLQAIDKIKLKQEQLKDKSIKLLNEKQKLKPIVDDLIQQIRIIQEFIESDISKRYKNRIVNLLGSITK